MKPINLNKQIKEIDNEIKSLKELKKRLVEISKGNYVTRKEIGF
jgi:hypothetical protein